jgi:CMP-N-acetylneuraminic acid synthetase
MKLGVFIPGRLQSERLPNKLILPLGVSCLWDIALTKLDTLPDKYAKVALAHEEELIQMAAKYQSVMVLKRESRTAFVDGPLKFIFKDLEKVDATHLMFLNPCLSFLSLETIVKALDEFERQNMNYATSVKIFQNWLFDSEGDPVNDIAYERLSTKEVPKLWQAAHCFHIFNKKAFLNDGMMLKPRHGIIEVPHEETFDIDTALDYEYAKYRHAKKYVIDLEGILCRFDTPKSIEPIIEPIEKNIRRVNKLYEAGNEIVLWTSWNGDSGSNFKTQLERQLKEWGVHYHAIRYDKPCGDIFVDKKAVDYRNWE